MKRKLLCMLMLGIMCVTALATGVMLSAAAADGVAEWISDSGNTGVTLVDHTTYKQVTGLADSVVTLNYSEKVDFSQGATIRFLIPSVNDMTISGTARRDNSNYVSVKVFNAEGKGIEMRIRCLYTGTESYVQKMETDVFYYDPAINRQGVENNVVAGCRYLETIQTYVASEATSHYIDIHKESGMWFFAIDDLTAMPTHTLDTLDLSDATVTVAYYSLTKTPSFRMYPITAGIRKTYIEKDFIQFGSDVITKLDDDTIKYKIADNRAAQFKGTLMRYREHLVSAEGFDVTKPINIEYSYDVSNASAVWYAVGIGRPDVLDSITKMQYNVFGYGTAPIDTVLTDYGDAIALKNDGIMFQTTTGLAQQTMSSSPTEPDNRPTVPYTTNSASKPYSGRSNMDLLTFIVGENNSAVYHNGTLLYDNLRTKKSDFEASGYRAYPFFHFFEDNANTAKGNTIVIKGVEAAIRTDKADLRVVGNSGQDLSVGLDGRNNGAIKLYEAADGGLSELEASLYSYDAADKKLTVKYDYFDGKTYDVYKLYARNNGGSEELVIRFSDPELVTEPPVTDKSEYFWKVNAGTEDLVVQVDIKNGTWSSFSGSGIRSSQWVYTPGEDSTVGTITIDKDFLNTKNAGRITFIVRTTDVEDNEYSCEFVVNVAEEEDVVTPPSGGGDGGCSGCNASSGGTVAFLAILALVFFAKKRL